MWLEAAYGQLLPNSSYPTPANLRRSLKATLTGYGQMVQAKVDAGWSCTQLTFMFGQLPGSRDLQIQAMKDEVDRVYKTFLTRAFRRPANIPADSLPLFIGAADLPVFKRDKAKRLQVPTNGGLHFNGLLLIPPDTRLTVTPIEVLHQAGPTYTKVEGAIDRIHAQSVTHDHMRVTDYVLKTIANGLIDYDVGFLVLPKSADE